MTRLIDRRPAKTKTTILPLEVGRLLGALVLGSLVASSALADGVHNESIVIEGRLCASKNNSCVNPEDYSYLPFVDIKVKAVSPEIALEEVNPDSYIWLLHGGGRFGIWSYPNDASGSPLWVPLSIEGGAGDSLNLLFLDAAERIGINTTAPAYTLDVVGDRIRLSSGGKDIELRTDGSATDIQATNSDLFLRSISQGRNIVMNPLADDGNVGVGTNAPSAKLHVVGDTIVTGDVSLGSSRTLKHELAPVPQEEILERILDLPVYRWKYKADTLQAAHVGPMAEDMFERFGLGRDNRHLSPADSAGLALAAIQGLHQRLEAQVVALREVNAELEDENAGLERRLEALERAVLEMAGTGSSGQSGASGVDVMAVNKQDGLEHGVGD